MSENIKFQPNTYTTNPDAYDRAAIAAEMPSEQASTSEAMDYRRDAMDAWSTAHHEVSTEHARQLAAKKAQLDKWQADNPHLSVDALKRGWKTYHDLEQDGVYGGEHTYNASNDHKYHRSQSYSDKAAPNGDIVRTYEAAQPEAGIHGKPRAAGPRVIIQSPLASRGIGYKGTAKPY